jgi:hypothetical protein
MAFPESTEWSRVVRTVAFIAILTVAIAAAWAYTHPSSTSHYTRACGITTAGPADVETLGGDVPADIETPRGNVSADVGTPDGNRDSNASIDATATATSGDGPGVEDPEIDDPDGDTLPSHLEREYGSDPHRKSLYVHLVYGADQPRLDAEERACLQDRWAALPIANPDGSTGVEVFFRGETRLDRPLSFDERVAVPRYFEDNLGSARPARCTDHVVFVGHSRWPGRRGVATIGGYASVVDVANSTTPVKFLSHELLHNVVGFLDEDRRIHTRRGLLSTNATDWSLSARPRQILDESGFRAGYGGNTIYGNCQAT